MAFVINRGTKDKPRWCARYKDADGTWKQRATGQPNKAAAVAWAREVEARVKRGQIGVPEPSPEEKALRTMTVKSFAELFLQEYSRPRIKDLSAYRRHTRRIFSGQLYPYSIADIIASDVKPLHVQRWRDEMTAKYVPAVVNRAISTLSGVFTWAFDQEMLTGRNPCSKVERVPMRPSEDFYSIEEVHRLLSLPEPPPMIMAAFYQGLRKGELLGLTWPCLHLDAEIPHVEVKRSYDGPPKNGKPRVIPLHRELIPALRAWRERCPVALHPGPALPAHAWTGGKGEPLVFPLRGRKGPRMGGGNDMANIRMILELAKCHVPADPYHAMRHSFSTFFLEASGNGDALSKMLGHSQGGNGMAAVSAGYTHTGLAYLHRELSKMTLVPPNAEVPRQRQKGRLTLVPKSA